MLYFFNSRKTLIKVGATLDFSNKELEIPYPSPFNDSFRERNLTTEVH